MACQVLLEHAEEIMLTSDSPLENWHEMPEGEKAAVASEHLFHRFDDDSSGHLSYEAVTPLTSLTTPLTRGLTRGPVLIGSAF